MQTQHPNLERWESMSLAQQLGNVGSEVSRAFNWEQKGDVEQKNRALIRALELLDLSLGDKRWNYPKLKEMARVREALSGILINKDYFMVSLQSFQKYFLYFGILARAGR